jgi:membrane associated rhomboid family serine protease
MKQEGVQRIVPTTPSQRRRYGDANATRLIIGITVAMFVLTGFGNPQSAIFQNLAQSNSAVAAGEWWRIFTPILLHGGITHILFNMWALWVLGPQIERGVGTWPFVSLYVAAAGVGGVTAYYWGGNFDIAVGASGAIFGLFGVWLNWALRRRNTAWGRSMLGQLGFLLLINAAIPFLIPGISWQAHLGGLLAGFAIGEMWSRVKGANATQYRTAIGFLLAAVAAAAVII